MVLHSYRYSLLYPVLNQKLFLEPGSELSPSSASFYLMLITTLRGGWCIPVLWVSRQTHAGNFRSRPTEKVK